MAKAVREPGSLKTLSFKELQKELNRRIKRVQKLRRKRDSFLNKAETISQQIREVESFMDRAGGGKMVGGKRVRNDANLASVLAKVLAGKTLGPADAADAALAAGYRTNAENFRTIVNQTLLKHKKLFKKTGRGQYTAA